MKQSSSLGDITLPSAPATSRKEVREEPRNLNVTRPSRSASVQLVYEKQRFVADRTGDEGARRMLVSMFGKNGRVYPHDPSRRGYHVVYRGNEVNHCPGCGRSHWYVGRLSAECGFCGTALPLADAGTYGVGLVRRGRPQPDDFADAA
jgi:hypothetical protein